MQKIIILEGHDQGGKSHIAAALSKELGIPVFKVQRDKYNWDKNANLAYGTEQITQFIEQSKCSVILDRFMPSDFMYSRLFDRDVDYDKIWELDLRFSQMNTLLVICYKNEENQIDDIEDKDFVNKSQYNEMTKIYRQYAAESNLKVLFLNTSDEDLENQLSLIKKNI